MSLKKILEASQINHEIIETEVKKIFENQISSTLTMLQTVMPEKTRKNGVKTIYASSPITTGYLMYDVLKQHGASSIDELKMMDGGIFLRNQIMTTNIKDGAEFADELRSKKYPFVIAPGEFFAKDWSQEHYMSLWEDVILKYSDIVCFNRNYHYSNGCVEELCIAIKGNKELRSRDGFLRLNPKEELSKIENAISHIESMNFDSGKLHATYDLLKDYLK